jgi:histidyl-tRNA synthetase
LGDYPIALEGIGELEEIIGYMESLGISEEYYSVKFAMVRGLDYYTGPIYETVVETPQIGSITGGGRFDDLVGMFTKRSYPAVGTSIGIERIIDVMEELDMFPPSVGKTSAQVLVTIFDESLASESLKTANMLRKGGLNTALYFGTTRLGNQIGYAGTKAIPYVVILGPDELEADEVTVRNLPLRTQQTVKRAEAVGLIKQWMAD